MSETYYVKTFGGLEITNDNVTVNIVELFGKQLVNLLQVLALQGVENLHY